MEQEQRTINEQYVELRKDVPALKDAALLHSPHFPHTLVGMVDLMMTFTIATYEEPNELGKRIMAALYEAQRILDDSIVKLEANIKKLQGVE